MIASVGPEQPDRCKHQDTTEDLQATIAQLQDDNARLDGLLGLPCNKTEATIARLKEDLEQERAKNAEELAAELSPEDLKAMCACTDKWDVEVAETKMKRTIAEALEILKENARLQDENDRFRDAPAVEVEISGGASTPLQKTVSELREENARLREEVERYKQANATFKHQERELKAANQENARLQEQQKTDFDALIVVCKKNKRLLDQIRVDSLPNPINATYKELQEENARLKGEMEKYQERDKRFMDGSLDDHLKRLEHENARLKGVLAQRDKDYAILGHANERLESCARHYADKGNWQSDNVVNCVMYAPKSVPAVEVDGTKVAREALEGGEGE